MNVRTVACTTTVLANANGSSSLQVASALVPRVDHHHHRLLSPTVAGRLFEMPAPIAPVHAD